MDVYPIDGKINRKARSTIVVGRQAKLPDDEQNRRVVLIVFGVASAGWPAKRSNIACAQKSNP
jgi:hypothetical protein